MKLFEVKLKVSIKLTKFLKLVWTKVGIGIIHTLADFRFNSFICGNLYTIKSLLKADADKIQNS